MYSFPFVQSRLDHRSFLGNHGHSPDDDNHAVQTPENGNNYGKKHVIATKSIDIIIISVKIINKPLLYNINAPLRRGRPGKTLPKPAR